MLMLTYQHFYENKENISDVEGIEIIKTYLINEFFSQRNICLAI